ncbi:MAG TPA: hypothetical protein PLF79_05185, partial [Thauera sp.]|nr:hypothetical protein [Thauera sp.]
MKTHDLDALKRVALKTLAAKADLRQPVLRDVAEDVLATTGKPVYRFTATAADKPNDPGVSVVLDDAGTVVDTSGLRAADGRALFRPKLPDFPFEALEPRRIKLDPSRNDLRLGEC